MLYLRPINGSSVVTKYHFFGRLFSVVCEPDIDLFFQWTFHGVQFT